MYRFPVFILSLGAFPSYIRVATFTATPQDRYRPLLTPLPSVVPLAYPLRSLKILEAAQSKILSPSIIIPTNKSSGISARRDH